jgi:rSAM/selenodomain-associated transferase 1
MATLVVFARAPVSGQVKTRLAARVGEEGALALYRAFVEDACRLAAAVAERRVLAVAGDPAAWAEVAARHDLVLEAQTDGDLGARMDHAIRAHAPACIIGSDSPSLPADYVREALARLETHEVVLGPSGDGGYWSIGAQRAVPELFGGIAWSTAAVLPETLRRLDGRRAWLLPFWYDVDDAEDLALLAAHLKHLPDDVAASTRAALSSAHLLY